MTKRRDYEPVDLKTVIADEDAARPRSQQTAIARAENRWGVGPSDIGRCRKAIQYRERPPEGFEPLPEDKIAAHVGAILHEGTAKALRRRRKGRRYRKVEADVYVPGFDVPGHVDLFEVPIGKVTDWKWIGEYAWENQTADGPREDDVDQVQLYGLGLEEMGYDVKEVCVTYVRRARPADIEAFVRPYDRVRALAAADRLHAVIDALDNGQDLPRDHQGPDFDGICRGCFARADCWQLDRAEEAGRSAAGWLYARDDAGIEAAAAVYDEAKELAKPFNDQKDYARNLLDGVPPGVYGGFEVTFSRPKPKPPVPDEVARLALLEEHLNDVVDGQAEPVRPEDLPHPTKPGKTATPSISVKRVRAAVMEARERERAGKCERCGADISDHTDGSTLCVMCVAEAATVAIGDTDSGEAAAS